MGTNGSFIGVRSGAKPNVSIRFTAIVSPVELRRARRHQGLVVLGERIEKSRVGDSMALNLKSRYGAKNSFWLRTGIGVWVGVHYIWISNRAVVELRK